MGPLPGPARAGVPRVTHLVMPGGACVRWRRLLVRVRVARYSYKVSVARTT
jgi:hypothetical protein